MKFINKLSFQSKLLRILSVYLPLQLACGLAIGQGVIGTPNADKVISGVSVVSGYHCSSKDIDVYIDNSIYLGKAGAGTTLQGTLAVCGRTDTGWSILYNFNNLASGQHTVTAYADGQIFDSHNFSTVRSGGVPWLTNVSKTITAENFPQTGQTAILEWEQSYQNFIVKQIIDTSTLNGTYALQRISLQDVNGNIVDSLQSNVDATGTFIVNGSSYSQAITLTINGVANSVSTAGNFTDYGYYFYDINNGQTGIIVDRGVGFITSVLIYNPTLGYVNEIDYWIRVQ